MTYPASITVLPNIFEDADGAQTESFTIPATPPYTHVLGASLTPPYPSGYQIVPPSGVAGVVSISGGGYGSWSEVTNGSSLSGGQFSVDYTTSPTGGIVTFSSADAGKSVTATWTGATLLNHPLIQGLVNALRDINTAAGAASGFAATDANNHTAQAPAVGVRQSVFAPSTSGGNLTATSWTNVPFLTAPQITTTAQGRIRFRLSIVNLNSGGAPVGVSFQVIINGVTYSLGQAYITSTSENRGHGYVVRTPVLTPGTYTAQLQYQVSSAVNVGLATGNLTIELDEVA